MPIEEDQPWRKQVLLDHIAAAISATRTHPEKIYLNYVLVQLEDIEARLKDGETLSRQYRRSLFFDTVAIRELDNIAETHNEYLNLLSEIAYAIDMLDPAMEGP